MNEPCEIDALIFDGPSQPYREHSIRAHYLKAPHDQECLVEVMKCDVVAHSFRFPAYKAWNIAAHHQDIIDGIIERSDSGIRAAAWDGITGLHQVKL